MSNTQLRIISAVVMAALVGFILYLGVVPTLIFLSVAGVICVDEFLCNFLNKKRFGLVYIVTQALFISVFIFFHLVRRDVGINTVIVNMSVLFNIILLTYLFLSKMTSNHFVDFFKSYSFLISVFFLLPFFALASLLFYANWLYLIIIILLVNFGMDTGAWFFGKNFGKHKLWPTVSPNKTIEGVLGGALTSGVVGSIAWYFFINKTSLSLFPVFMILGAFSQIGDLIQSKLKRQVGIKDSSHLIPGHGGVYDRIDSLIFIAPIYAVLVNFLLH